MTSDEKIPAPHVPPQTTLHKSLGFWSSVLLIFDKKIQTLEEVHGYGEISLTVTVHRGKVNKVTWNDKFYSNDLVEKAGGANRTLVEEHKEDEKAK